MARPQACRCSWTSACKESSRSARLTTPLEREADQVADAVMSRGSFARESVARSVAPWNYPRIHPGFGNASVQRKCACGGEGECDECKRNAASNLEVNRKTNELYVQRVSLGETGPAAVGTATTGTPGARCQPRVDCRRQRNRRGHWADEEERVSGAVAAADYKRGPGRITGTSWAAVGSVAIEPWFQNYAGQSAQQLERTIRTETPGSAGVIQAQDCVLLVAQEVGKKVREQVLPGSEAARAQRRP